MKSVFFSLVSANALLVFGGNLIQNPSFENPALQADWSLGSVRYFYGGSVIGGAWNVNGPADRNVVTVHQNFNIFADAVPHGFGPAQSGLHYLDLSSAYTSGVAPSVSQDFPTVTGAEYRLSFYLGASDGFNATPNSEHPPLNSVNVQLADVFGPSILDEMLTASPPLNGEIHWVEHTFLFNATSSFTRLTFHDLSGYDDNTSFIDAVSIEAVQGVPEALPAGWMVCALAAVVTVSRVRKCKP